MKKISIISMLCIMSIGIMACGKQSGQMVESFREKIEQKKEAEMVSFNDLTDFQWEYMYTFEPYTSREEIEEIIGFQSKSIADNMIDESTVYLLFTKDDSVVGTIMGSPGSLGYQIDFGTYEKYLRLDAEEENTFLVKQEEELVSLEYMDE